MLTPLPVTERSRRAFRHLKDILGPGAAELSAHVVHALEGARRVETQRRILRALPELQLTTQEYDRLLAVLGYLPHDHCDREGCGKPILPHDPLVYDKGSARVWCSLECFRGDL